MDKLPEPATSSPEQAASPRLQCIARQERCGQIISTYSLCLQMQLLFASSGIIAGIWWHDIKPKIERLIGANHVLTIKRAVCERVNVHRMRVTFIFTTRHDAASPRPINFNHDMEKDRYGFYWHRRIITHFSALSLMKKSEAMIALEQEKRAGDRSVTLLSVLQPAQIKNYVNRLCHTSNTFCTFDFWESETWWQPVLNECPAWLFEDSGAHCDRAKSARLLNHLMRVLLQNLRLTGIGSAVDLLRRMPVQKINLLKRLYVEPTDGSLFASCISTIFMHNKQQHGLNTKHAATQKGQSLPGSPVNQAHYQQLRSVQSFDAKIFLDMCASCDKREIFEIMLSINRKRHHREAAVQSTADDSDNNRLSPILCSCEICGTLRDVANAWQYFDCGQFAWLRLEFNRRFYAKVCLLLEPVVLQREEDTRLIYTSYKNEFTTREKFVSNFVNYYSFYENNEQPLTMDKCYGKMRQMVSTIFLFGNINWTLIEKAAAKGVPCHSISLNQQSLFKSLDNTLYAIFSENSIYRMSKETRQTTLSVNAPYVNRGMGAVPNCGINAFSAQIAFIFDE